MVPFDQNPTLVEHTREYFYCGHDKEIVEKALFL